MTSDLLTLSLVMCALGISFRIGMDVGEVIFTVAARRLLRWLRARKERQIEQDEGGWSV